MSSLQLLFTEECLKIVIIWNEKDWMDLFDVIFVKSGKPVFFTNYNAPMFPLDLN